MECISRGVLCGLLLVTSAVQADVFAGKSGSDVASNTVMRFTDDQSGDVAPAATFGGALSELISAHDMAWLQTSKELYVSDFWGQAIRVYNQTAGDAAPVRTITNPNLGQPRQLVLIPEHNELMVITQLNFVSTFALDADGNAVRLRIIGNFPNPLSGLDNPSGLAYNPVTDEIYVGDYQFDGDETYNAEVLVFPRTANGDVAPSRVIAGSNTQMGTYVIELELNPLNNELYVLTDGPQYSDPYIVSTFPSNASGNVESLRRITGAATGLNISTAMSFDTVNDRLIVASDAYNSLTAPGLLFFPRTANGNVAPGQIIRGTQTGTSLGNGWYSVLAVDLSFIFADGFEN